MSLQSPDSNLLERLLIHLKVGNRKPSQKALAELVAAFVTRVPFENVSKLYYMKHHNLRRLPNLEQLIEGIERYNFGGTCYSNNYCLHLLLAHLGYDVMLCGADMENPDVHLVNMVSLEGREFIIDAGYAAPFLEPLSRDLKQDYVIALGRDRYVLKPKDRNGNSRLELYRDGHHKHGYMAKPVPRQIEYFARVIEDSYCDSSTFMNALLLVRFFPDRSLVIHNLSVIESQGMDYHIHQLRDRDELPKVVEKYFSIPREIVSEAIAELGEFGDAWS
ncbi:MAG: arylamine N-acetyltransferase [FCB group bacterium]|nr:arylamine N-acetyltransferase [FCB group bacterium]